MRRYSIVSGILLILPIIDFALAAPVLVQEKRQAGVDVLHTPEDTITMLGKRGDELNELWLKLLNEDHFAKPEESSATRPSSGSPPSGPADGWVDVEEQPLSDPGGWSPVSSPVHTPSSPGSLTESVYENAPLGPSSPALSTMSDADHKLVGAHAPPNPGLSTESDHELTGVHAPLSSPVFPSWFLTDHGSMGHGPQEFDPDHRLVVEEQPSRPASPTEFDAGHEYQVVHPPPPSPGSASPTEPDYEMVDGRSVPLSSQVSSTNPDRRSMGADSRLENLQAVSDSDALRGNAKKSRRISGTARDVLNSA
jgi:hypothetical protein